MQPDLDHPDRFILDLDPDPSLSWQTTTDAATLSKMLLDEIGLMCFVQTSSGKGYHIVVPLTLRQGWQEINSFSQLVTRYMAMLMQEKFSAVLGPKNRVRKIPFDYLRNGKGTTTVATFSSRASPGLCVSTAIHCDDPLPQIASAILVPIRTIGSKSLPTAPLGKLLSIVPGFEERKCRWPECSLSGQQLVNAVCKRHNLRDAHPDPGLYPASTPAVNSQLHLPL